MLFGLHTQQRECDRACAKHPDLASVTQVSLMHSTLMSMLVASLCYPALLSATGALCEDPGSTVASMIYLEVVLVTLTHLAATHMI